MAKTSTTLFINSAVLIGAGAIVIWTGRVWNIMLHENKYIAGGVTILFGVLVGILGLRQRMRGK